MNNKHWSKKDIQYLKGNYGKVDNKILSAKLGRSLDAIRWKADSLGLTKSNTEWTKKELRFLYNNIAKLDYREIAEKLNKSYSQVIYRIKIEAETNPLAFKIPNNIPYVLQKKVITLIKASRATDVTTLNN